MPGADAGSLKARAWPLALGLVPGLAVPLLWGGTDALARLGALSPGLLAGAAVMAAGCWALNAARLRVLFNHLGAHLGGLQALRMLLAVEFGLCVLPANAGGAVVWSLLGHRAGLRGAGGLAAYACDQAVDVVFFAVAVPMAAAWAWHRAALPLPGGWVAVQCAGALAGLGAVALVVWRVAPRRGRVARVPGRLIRRLGLPRRARARARFFGQHLAAAFEHLRRLPWRARALLVVLASAHWLVRYSILALLLHGLGAGQPWAFLFLAQTGALALGHLVALPGGAGSVEGAMAAMLHGRADAATLGAALLAWRVCTYHLYLLAGALGWAAVFAPGHRPAARVDLQTTLVQSGGDRP